MALGTDRRGLVRTGIAGTAVLLAAALLVIVNYFGWKYHQRFDWTESRLYTLSEKTENVLAALERDVEVFVFLDPQDELFEPTRELLARYDAASQRLSVRVVDLAKNLMETQRLVDRFELDRAAVVFASGEETRVVPRTDLARFDLTAMQFGAEEVDSFQGEQRFTRALIDLVEVEQPRAVFTVGHGERRLDDRGLRGLGTLQRLLAADNFELEEWSSLGAAAVPEGTALVVVAGPTSGFLPAELELLDAYLEADGALLVLLDSPLEAGADRALADWLAGYGVEVGDDTVVDPEYSQPTYGAGTFTVSRYPSEHAITAPLAADELPVLLSLARSVRPAEKPEGLAVQALLAGSAESWGETDATELAHGPGDTPGPVPLGVVVERPDGAADAVEAEDLAEPVGEDDFLAEAGEEPAAGETRRGLRLAVYGDSDLATDQFLAWPPNTALLSTTVNWLAERQALVAIPPRELGGSRLDLTGSELRWLYLLALVLLPGLGLVAGAVVWYRRRR